MTEQKLPARNMKLRMDAALIYLSSPKDISLEQLADHPRIRDEVSLRTLERWSSEDRWVERRQQYLEKWAEKAKEEIGSKMVEMRLKDLDDLSEARQLLMTWLSDEEAKPKSFEGLVKALVELSKREEQLQLGIGNVLMPPGTQLDVEKPEEIKGPPVPKLSPSEANDLARGLLKIRRGSKQSTPEE